MSEAGFDPSKPIEQIRREQIPVPEHRTYGVGRFLGLYAAEHVAATGFLIGATFAGLGASIGDILLGLLIGNLLAVLGYWLICAPIAVDTRLTLFAYLERIAGRHVARLYNLVSVLVFGLVSAAMITVSAMAVRTVFHLPPQDMPYPTDFVFVLVVLGIGGLVTMVAARGFHVLSAFASICAPWLVVMFVLGGVVLLPRLAQTVSGYTTLHGVHDFILIAGKTLFTGMNSAGQPGIGLWEVAGFAWAANACAHFGLVDMALFRYARRKRYGLASAAGMLFGHYVGWISAGVMGAATAAAMQVSITMAEPGDVAFMAFGTTGFVIAIIAGWTTANANLYRAGLAARAVLPRLSHVRATLLVGSAVVVAACFPFVCHSILPLLMYGGLILVPVGGIVFAEHQLFPRLGMTRYWAGFRGLATNVPAIAAWGGALASAFGLDVLDLIPFQFLFVVAWLVSIILYTLLARVSGALEGYPEQEAILADFRQRVTAQHAALAKREKPPGRGPRVWVSWLIRVVWIVVGLLVPLVLAIRVLLFSPDLYFYYVNREMFYDIAIWCTFVYFIFAYWDWRRCRESQLNSGFGAHPTDPAHDSGPRP